MTATSKVGKCIVIDVVRKPISLSYMQAPNSKYVTIVVKNLNRDPRHLYDVKDTLNDENCTYPAFLPEQIAPRSLRVVSL